MPYARNAELPSSVRSNLPAAAQSRFRQVVNSRLAADQSEQSAFRQAWHSVSQGWEKPKDGGKWVRKAEPFRWPGEEDEEEDREYDESGRAVFNWPKRHRKVDPQALRVHLSKLKQKYNTLIQAYETAEREFKHAKALYRQRNDAALLERLKGLKSRCKTLLAGMAKLKDRISRTRSALQLAVGKTGITYPTYEEPTTKRWVQKEAKTLYVYRPLLNGDAFVEWAKAQGFGKTLQPGDLHVTIAYSKDKLNWPEPKTTRITVKASKGRTIEQLGDKGAYVLRFESDLLERRWNGLKVRGASSDYDEYKPHVTITYQPPEGFDPSRVKPFTRPLIFGPEKFEEITGSPEITEKARELIPFQKRALDFDEAVEKLQPEVFKYKVLKADKELGIVFGWAIVSTENGQPYYDTQGDFIPEESMLKAATEFMLAKRTMKIMHSGRKVGTFVFAWPMTEEIAEAMDIQSSRTGLMVAIKPDNPNVLERFRTGQYTGFSIGGNRVVDEPAE